jgi:hypothetical protein
VRAYEFDPKIWQLAVVAEIMVNPVNLAPGSGQWVEIRNPSEAPVNLQGMVLMTLNGGFHVISPAKEIPIPPAGSVVLGRAVETGVNGGAAVDYAYGGEILLDLDADAVFLLQGGVLVDVVVYGPDSIVVDPGRTLSLEPSSPDGTGAKQWCTGRVPYGDSGNFGTPGLPNTWCDGDNDGKAEDQGDCNDADGAVQPGAKENCNGIDDDCDGETDEDVTPTQGCLAQGICAGTFPECRGAEGFVCGYPAGYEAVEVTCDGIDNDCDGDTDEGLDAQGECLAAGVCAGSAYACLGKAGFRCTYPDTWQQEETRCDGLDNDCDGDTDEGHDVGKPCVSGQGGCAREGKRVCAKDGSGAHCDVAAGLPETEICGDGVDNDCDGLVDEGFPVNEVCQVGIGACVAVGKYRCSPDGLSAACQAVPGTPVPEVCGDGVDNDCDGDVDEADCSRPASPRKGCSAGPDGSAPGLFLFLAALSFGIGRQFRKSAIR